MRISSCALPALSTLCHRHEDIDRDRDISIVFVVVVARAVIVIIVLDVAAGGGGAGAGAAAAPFECQRRRSDSIVLRQGTADASRIARFEVNKQFCKATAGAQLLSAASTARNSGV